MRRTLDVTLFCTCPRCYGKRFFTIVEWFEDHRGMTTLLTNEVSLELPHPGQHIDEILTFKGTQDEDGSDLEVLVTVFPNDDMAEVAYRRHYWETWSAPTRLQATT